MLLDAHRPGGELEDFVISQREPRAQLFGHRLQRGPPVAVDHALFLGALGLPDQRPVSFAQGVLVHVELVGDDLPLDHGFAEPVAGSDQHDAAVAGLGIQREEDTRGGLVAAHHLLDADAQRDVKMIEPHVRAIADRPRGKERGEAPLHGVEKGLVAADVQERVLLPREARAGKVLGRCRRAHRDVGIVPAEPSRQRPVCGQRLVSDLLRDRGGSDPRPNLGAARDQPLHVVQVDASQQRADGLVQPGGGDEVPVRFGGDGESVRNADAQG